MNADTVWIPNNTYFNKFKDKITFFKLLNLWTSSATAPAAAYEFISLFIVFDIGHSWPTRVRRTMGINMRTTRVSLMLWKDKNALYSSVQNNDWCDTSKRIRWWSPKAMLKSQLVLLQFCHPFLALSSQFLIYSKNSNGEGGDECCLRIVSLFALNTFSNEIFC